jgi:hypothetical protein
MTGKQRLGEEYISPKCILAEGQTLTTATKFILTLAVIMIRSDAGKYTLNQSARTIDH